MTRGVRALLIGSFAFLGIATVVKVAYNPTPSVPRGWYLSVPVVRLQHGDLVAVCLEEPILSLVLARGYQGPGPCPGRIAPLGKYIAGIPGDTVTIDSAGVQINGRRLRTSRALATDRGGRPLPHLPAGRFVLKPDRYWLHSDHTPRAFDSRYFGAVSRATIRRHMIPLHTATTPGSPT